MFLEIEVDPCTGQEKGQQKVSKDDIIAKHPTIHDLVAWASGARIGSVFSIMAHGYKYKRLEG